MWQRTSFGFAVALCVILCPLLGFAQNVDSRVYVPPKLKPWVPWVLHGHQEQLDCAHWQERMICQWPARLDVSVEQKQGRFSLDVWVDARSNIILPGGKRHWPQSVTVDLKPTLVQQNGKGLAMVSVPAGQHKISGILPWKSAPEMIEVPSDVAQVSLNVDGKAVSSPRLDEQGRLWIRESGSAKDASETDALRVSIYRKFTDGVPLKVSTMLELNVSGRTREVSMGKVLLKDTRPSSIKSNLPIQVQADGDVKVYVRPGRHTVQIDAFLPLIVKSLNVPKMTNKHIEPQEVWVWQPDEALRSVVLSGLPSIDPARTSLPKVWHGHVTMLAKPSAKLTLKTSRRGLETHQPNLLYLKRQIWLDLDGVGYTFKDHLSGKLHQGWRLNFGSKGQLGRVTKVNTKDDLLITKDAKKNSGVELRERKINLNAEGRYDHTLQHLDIVGWNHNVQSLQADLHLPPGWSLLGVAGVDQVRNTWIDSWSLFEFFILLLIAFAMGRLFGWPWGLVAGVAMVLAHGHQDAPRYVWFHLIAALGLLRLLPLERVWLRRIVMGYLGVSCLGFLVIFGPYAQKQIRYGMYPQIQKYTNRSFSNMSHSSIVESSKLAKGDFKTEDIKEVASNEQRFRAGGKRSFAIKKPAAQMNRLQNQYSSQNISSNDWLTSNLYQQIDPNEVVQTGPGLPDWRWERWTLKWNGPVVRDHQIKLWLLSPRVNLLLRWLSVFFFVLMILAMIHPKRFAVNSSKHKGRFDLWDGFKRIIIPSAMAMCVLAPNLAQAQDGLMPTNDVMNTLRTRLLKKPACVATQNCLVVSRSDISIDGQSLNMKTELHAQVATVWVIPGPVNVMLPTMVKLNGVPTTQLRRRSDQMLAVRIPKGRHTVEVTGVLQSKNVATVQFEPSSKPRYITVRAKQWTVDGMDEFGRPENSLQLSRIKKQTDKQDATPNLSERELPPWFFVQRVISLSLPWQTTTTVTREVADRPQLVKVPLLPGESVITDGVRVEKKEALVYFPRGTQQVEYRSELATQEVLQLTAATNQPWTETWSLECTRIWRCTYEGINPVHVVGAQGVFEPMWKPWPGERVTLKVNKPTSAPGSGSTVDQVNYLVEPGKRLLRATLTMRVRASQGGWQTITLPKGAQVQEVFIDGKAKSIQPRDGKLSLPLTPGARRFKIRWQQPTSSTMIARAPVVDLGSPAVNVDVHIKTPRQRWLLWTSGPAWGPAVLFWSHLVWMLFLALLLGRMKHLPVKTYQWILLVLGMSQLPIVAVVPIVAWFTLLCWRKARTSDHWAAFNANQLAIVIVSLITAIVLYAAVHVNLLVNVDMQVRGNGSSGSMLKWYVDRCAGQTPSASVWSVPLLVWRGAMLLWALWLVSQLLRWLPWAWRIFGHEKFWMMPPRPPMEPQMATTEATSTMTQAADGHVGDQDAVVESKSEA